MSIGDAAPLAVTVGDPAGIGPEVAVRAALAEPDRPTVIVGPGEVVARVFAEAGAATPAVVAAGTAPPRSGSGVRAIVDTGEAGPIEPGRPSAAGGRAQLRALDEATRLVGSGAARALVTAPTSKEACTRAGVAFTGQTEHLAVGAGLARDAVTMLFLGPRLRVGLVTTHLALRDVPDAVTGPRVIRTLEHLAEAVLRWGRGKADPSAPTVVVAGLNPHAGEAGLFGDEESRVIAPALADATSRPPFSTGAVRCLGLRPAEAAFRAAASGEVDGVVAMAHDQATIASKLLDWGEAVNVTWGLPFVRTSVDHGVAYDIAGTGRASASGMRAAIRLADRLTRPDDASSDG